MTSAATAWNDYWRSGAAGGCVEANPAITAATGAVWRELAGRMPRRARVLDLATGSGAVLRVLAGARPDLALEGVDLATDLPSLPVRARIRTGCALEQLPFADARFAAVTSQFGYEYATADAAAEQAARVLAPGGRLLLVIHRSDGPVVRHNAARASALAWATGADGPIEQARPAARTRLTLPSLPPPRQVAELGVEARRRFPDQRVAGEIVAATMQALGDPSPHRGLATLDRLAMTARAETGRLTALAAAARDVAGVEKDRERFRTLGLTVDPAMALTERPGAPAFAWVLAAAKPAS